MQIRAHSPRTFSSPRKRNCRNPRACLICPNTGSTMNFRVAYTAAPTWFARFAPFVVLLLSRRYESCDLPLIQVLQILIRAIPIVGHNFFRFLSRLFFDPLQQRHQLLFIIRGLRDLLPYDQLEDRFDGDLCVVALYKSIRPFQDTGLGIGKVVLRFLRGLRFLGVLPLAPDLLPRPLFQRAFGFPYPGDPRFPSLQLFWQLVSPAIPTVTLILFFVRRRCLAQQLAHFLPQPLLRLLHPSVAHGLVLTRVALDLTPIQRHPPQLHGSRLQRQL